LESLGFEWGSHVAAWEDRLSELADYRKIHGHCNVPKRYIENIQMGYWVSKQRNNYRMTLTRIQKLESLGFEWSSHGTSWEDRLSELADYRKIHGHCKEQQRSPVVLNVTRFKVWYRISLSLASSYVSYINIACVQ
jgi:hypothetical protein